MKNWKHNLAALWSAQFIGMSAITGIISFLPLYVPYLGVTDEASVAMWSGLLIGSAAFCAALSNPFWGAIADRRGRKPMVEKVLLLFGLIMIAMAYVTNVYQLLGLRLLQGLCGGFSAAATALAVSMTPAQHIAATVGWFQTSLIIGGAVGPLLGGVIADYWGFRQPFIIFGVLCLLSLTVIHCSVKETFQPAAASQRPSLQETARFVWSLHDLRLMLLVQFLAQFAIHSFGPILPLYIQTLMTDTNNLASISGTIIAIAGLSSAISAAGMGLLTKHFSHKQILVTAACLGGLSFIGQLAAPNVTMLALLRAINGLCIGAMVPSSNTIVTYLIPEEKRGAAYGITSGAALMGNVTGPILAGFLAMGLGLSSIFWLTAALFFVVAALLFCRIKTSYAAPPAASLAGKK